jgi:hypothetical protein
MVQVWTGRTAADPGGGAAQRAAAEAGQDPALAEEEEDPDAAPGETIASSLPCDDRVIAVVR